MSVVIAAKYKDGVAIAADTQVTIYKQNANMSGSKLHSFKYSKSVIGVVGCLRDINVIKTLEEIIPYKDILDEIVVDDIYLSKVVIPSLVETFKENGRLPEEKPYCLDSEFLYVNAGSIYRIFEDFSVLAPDACCEVIGCGSDKVMGFMSEIGDTSSFSEEKIKETLAKAIRKACEKDVYIGDKYDIQLLKKG